MRLVWKQIIRDKVQLSNIHKNVLFKGECLTPSFVFFFLIKQKQGWLLEIPKEGLLSQTFKCLNLKQAYKIQNGI